MRVFVTGATGYIGSAVVKAFVDKGWEVGALVRDVSSEPRAREMGAVPIVGRLQDPETYQHFCAESQAVVHCAFESPDVDEQAVEEMLGALQAEGGRKHFVYTSGVWVLGRTRGVADEAAPTDAPLPLVAWRPAIERWVLGHAKNELTTSVVRPAMVYGGHGGLFAGWWDEATRGTLTFVGDGANHAPTVHRNDLAELFRTIVDRRATGMFHAAEDASPTLAQLARACGEAVGPHVEVRSWPLADARAKLGAFADAWVLDQQVSAQRARALGWAPKREPFIRNAKAVFDEWRAG